jgi:hypothetical protein
MSDLNLAYSAPGASEIAACEILARAGFRTISANVKHELVAGEVVIPSGSGPTIGLTSVTSQTVAELCPSAVSLDPLEALIDLIDRREDGDAWVVLAHLGGPPAVTLAERFVAGDLPVG